LSVQRYNSEAVLQSLLSDPTTHKPPRIISSVQRLRPPVYSPEIIALLTSPQARRKGKTLELSSLESPPILPVRADPSSEEARIYGPFSKRRDVNIRWLYLTTNIKKISLPIEISVRDEGQAMSGSQEVVGARGIGLQGAGVLREVQEIAGHSQAPPIPRRQRCACASETPSDSTPKRDSRAAPNRFLRRRYKQLLGRLPLLVYSPNKTADNSPQAAYTVSLAQNSISPHNRRPNIHQADSIDVEWWNLWLVSGHTIAGKR